VANPAAPCANCETVLIGEWCHACGQKRAHAGDLSLRHAGHHVVHELLHLDGRLWTTLRLLFARPGQLSLDFLEGRRQRHLHPIRIFLVTAALFFLLGNATVLRLAHIEERAPRLGPLLERKASRAGMAKADYIASRDPILQTTYKAATIASVIAVGALQMLLFRRRWRAVGEHLTIAAHNASAAFALNLPVGWAMTLVPVTWAPLAALALVAGVYDWLAFRRAYGEPPLATTLKTLAVVALTLAWSWIAMAVAFRRALA
jgi:hypothetical protein